jgi:acetyl esterase/lipase
MKLPRRAAIAGGVAALGGLTASLAGCAKVDLLNATIPTSGLDITRDLAYDTDPRGKLDIYEPKGGPEDPPVIVFFYGGTWQTGSKHDYLFAAEALSETGAIVVVPDYRVYPEVTFPGFLEDGAKAVAWTFDHIGKWGGDRNNIFLAGHSAGAYIAIMLALDAQYLARAGVANSRLSGAIGISGPYDFLPITRPDIKSIFEVVPDLSVTQPIHFARGDAPPLLLLTGDADTTVGPYNTRNLAERIRALGGEVEADYYPGVDHIDAVIALTALFRDRAPELAAIRRFIAEHPPSVPPA